MRGAEASVSLSVQHHLRHRSRSRMTRRPSQHPHHRGVGGGLEVVGAAAIAVELTRRVAVVLIATGTPSSDRSPASRQILGRAASSRSRSAHHRGSCRNSRSNRAIRSRYSSTSARRGGSRRQRASRSLLGGASETRSVASTRRSVAAAEPTSAATVVRMPCVFLRDRRRDRSGRPDLPDDEFLGILDIRPFTAVTLVIPKEHSVDLTRHRRRHWPGWPPWAADRPGARVRTGGGRHQLRDQRRQVRVPVGVPMF